MVCALDSVMNGLGSSHGLGTAMCSHFPLVVPLFNSLRFINGYRRTPIFGIQAYWGIICRVFNAKSG